jgi:hypothetical protein
MHIFWVAGLLLAFIDIPDFGGFLGRIAGSVERMAGLRPGAGAEDVPEAGSAVPSRAAESAIDRQGDDGPPMAKKPMRAVSSSKEIDHA